MEYLGLSYLVCCPQSGFMHNKGGKRVKRIALVGMPNCGKSSLFNRLTGRHAHIGNRAGVTVRGEDAVFALDGKEVLLIDLPGIRSMNAVSADERETLRVLSEERLDLILFVCDATDFARHDILLHELIGLMETLDKCPQLVAVFNFCDELEAFPASKALETALGLPSVAISARRGTGLADLKILLAKLLFLTSAQNPSACRMIRTQSAVRVGKMLGATSRRSETRSARFDRLFFAPGGGYVLFMLVMAGILFLVFGPVGLRLTVLFRAFTVEPLSLFFTRMLQNAPLWLASLLSDGVLGGVGAVLDFLPRLLLLFAAQSLLEQTGILARFNRLFDRFTRRFGLTGEAMTALLLGFGCTVPAILCTRAMKNDCSACRCSCVLPAVACSARMPLCICVSQAFFGVGAWWVCGAVWLLSALCFFMFCAVCELFFPQRARLERHDDALPRWRAPVLSEIILAVREQSAHFLGRAGGMILLCSVAVWGLSSFDLHLQYIGNTGTEQSMMAAFGRLLSPLLLPIGLGDWRLTVALLTGIGAKEAALSTLGVLMGDGVTPLAESIASSGILTPASALSFLIFYCLYFPCAATVATLRAEHRPLRSLVPMLLFAYLLALAVYRLAVAIP